MLEYPIEVFARLLDNREVRVVFKKEDVLDSCWWLEKSPMDDDSDMDGPSKDLILFHKHGLFFEYIISFYHYDGGVGSPPDEYENPKKYKAIQITPMQVVEWYDAESRQLPPFLHPYAGPFLEDVIRQNQESAPRTYQHLKEIKRNALEAFLEAGAENAATRKSKAEIAGEAGYSEDELRLPLSELVHDEFLESKGGCNGGYWLTPKGKAAAQAIARDNSAPHKATQPIT